MPDIQVIDNFLDKNIHKNIKDVFLSRTFPWYFLNGVTFENDNDFFFVHDFYWDKQVLSNYFHDLILPIIGQIKFNNIVRIKANCYTKNNKKQEHLYHTDFDFNHNVMLYSINSNNGYTEFKTGEKILSTENRLIIFPGNLEHKSVTQTNTPLRVNININTI